MNWTGFYVGVHMGGGWSDDRWSDPFAATVGPKNFINAAGFGDTTRATGPLGGGQIGANWQTGSWVLGVKRTPAARTSRVRPVVSLALAAFCAGAPSMRSVRSPAGLAMPGTVRWLT